LGILRRLFGSLSYRRCDVVFRTFVESTKLATPEALVDEVTRMT
jgi:hypothetical protein